MEQLCISAAALRADLSALFQAVGVGAEDAGLLADGLVQAEQWGVRSHGVMRAERYVRCLQRGGIRPDAPFTVLRQRDGWALASANGGLGIPASMRAARLAVSLARSHGVGIVNVRESHHNGAEGLYTHYIAGQNMIGLAMSTGNPIMAASGGSRAVIGNNPFSWAAPAGRYGTVMMDIAMSAVADGKVQLARAAGTPLPPGCILDRNGHPSVDPEDYFAGGVLLPFGGHKGYGLAVMVECLAGILSGAALTGEIDSWNERPGRCGNTGHLLMAFDLSAMLPPEQFVSRVEQMIGQFKADDPDMVCYPGEPEQRRRQAAGDAVHLDSATAASLQRAAQAAGVPLQSISNRKGSGD